MTSYKVEIVDLSPISQVGEGPHWDIDRQSLYYVDLFSDKDSILRFDFKDNKVYSAFIPGHPRVSFIIPVDNTNDQFVVSSGKKFVIIKWDGKSNQASTVKVIGEVEQHIDGNCFNDAKCDPSGAIFAGTIPDQNEFFESRLGTFYRFTNKEKFVSLESNIGCSNGLTWNVKTNKFYYIDSMDWDIKEFDYDLETRNISNSRVVVDFTVNGERPGFGPDGMTIDDNGSLYVAAFGWSKVLKINPDTGVIELEIKLPAEQITSVAFGGPNLDILYVTSAAKEYRSKPTSLAGKLFAVTGLGVKGLPMKNYILN